MSTIKKNKELRVLVVHNSLSPYRLPLFQALSKVQGYKFKFLLTSKVEEGRPWQFETDLNIDYSVLYLKKFKIAGQTLNLGLDILRYASNHDIFILNDHLNMPELTLRMYAKVKRIPVMTWIETTRNSLQNMSKIKVELKALINRKSDGILVSGKEAGEYAFETTGSREKIFYSNNAVDNNVYKKAREIPTAYISDMKKRLGLNGLILSYFGQLIERKGLDVLFEAVKGMHQELRFNLLFVGDGPLRKELQSGFDSLFNRNLKITGYIDPSELPFYYAISDVMVLSSYVDVWGLVVNEAIAAGVPVICSTGAGASRDMVKHGKSGMVFEKGDVGALASDIKSMLSNEALRKSMVIEADKILENYTIKKARDQFVYAIDKTYESKN